MGWAARGGRLLLAMACGLLAVEGSAPAAACACGAFADPAGQHERRVIEGETAVISLSGGVETMIMGLAIDVDARGTTILMPTPSVPEVTAGSGDTLPEMARATAPRERVERTIWGPLGGMDAGSGPGAGITPDGVTVHQQGRIGQLEVAVLDGSVEGVTTWLAENGYQLPEPVVAELPGYVADGWTFTVMRLADDAEITGALDPRRLDFATDRLVYPMRLSHAAEDPQHVTVFVIGDEAVRRTDASAAQQTVRRPWIADPAQHGHAWEDPTLVEMTGDAGPAVVTQVDVDAEPSTITTDFTFEPDPRAAEVVPTYTTTEVITVLGIPVGWLLVLGGMVALPVVVAGVILGLVVLVRRRRA